AKIAALRGKAFITQRRHQRQPKIGDAKWVHARLCGPAGKAKAWKRGNHHVERNCGVAAMSRGIGEQWNNFQHFEKRAGPAVGKDQWDGRRPLAAFVNEVDRAVIRVVAVVMKG